MQVMQHLGSAGEGSVGDRQAGGTPPVELHQPLPIKDIYDRWISPYASGAVDLLARMKRELEK